MRYLGGKERIATWVCNNLRTVAGGCTSYLEPFVGSAAIFHRMAPRFESALAGDAHPDLILLLQAVAAGWIPPTSVSREEYEFYRTQPPSAMRGFVGFGSTWGGKWFGGYVDTAWDKYHNRYTKPYAQAASQSLARIAPALSGATFRCCSFEDWLIPPRTLIYCDPPYAGTTGYAAGDFDHEKFWSYAATWADYGQDCVVVVSEASAPTGWMSLDRRVRRAMLRDTKGIPQEDRVEALFIRDR